MAAGFFILRFMRILRKLLEQIEITNRRYGLFAKGDALVLGVSGGPDSMAMLFLFSKLQRKYRLKIIVAHLDHGLQGREGARHRLLVEKAARQLGCPFYAKGVKLRVLAKKNKRSLEEMGRLERYRFFEAVARKTAAGRIATAHTADDQTETMLFRILRGAGLKGLGGIPYKRWQGRFEVVRPLLSSEKEDLLSFLKQSGVSYWIDKSNRDTLFTRNRIRHDLLPKVRRDYNPRIKNSLTGLQVICADVQDYLDTVGAKIFEKCLLSKPRAKRKIVLNVSKLKRLHRAIQREVLRRAILERKGDLKQITFSHVENVVDLLYSRPYPRRLHLPGPITVWKGKTSLVVG